MRLRLGFLGCVVGSMLIAAACGGDGIVLDGGIDAASSDVTLDTMTPPDTGSDVGTSDTGTNDTGTNDASDGGKDTGSTGISIWTCGTATVTDCTQCIGHTQPCVYCADTDASALAGVCVQQNTGCGNGAPNGYNLCVCPRDAGTCPEAFQVCLPVGGPNGVCDTCGAVNGTNGLTCENGGKCDAVDGGCL